MNAVCLINSDDHDIWHGLNGRNIFTKCLFTHLTYFLHRIQDFDRLLLYFCRVNAGDDDEDVVKCEFYAPYLVVFAFHIQDSQYK